MTILLKLFGVILVVTDCSNSVEVSYEILSTLYLPYTYTPTPAYALGEDAAEQLAYDKEAKLIYSIGNTNIHVIDISDVTNPAVVFRVTYPGTHVTDVAVCGQYVFATFTRETEPDRGFLNVYRTYNKSTNSLDLLDSVIVGPTPDMVKPTSDCKKILVAVEGEPYDDVTTQSLIDKPGGIGVVTLTGGSSVGLQYTLIDFQKFDNQYDILKGSGVRFVYQGTETDPNSFSNDLEPEYIEFSTDESKAYITLQENNAIAVFNMATSQVEGIYGLGFKSWSDYTLDPSDTDGGISLKSYPVFGMYQPRAIKYFTHNGIDYVVTANEGDSKDYDYFTEESRVVNLTLSSNFGTATEISSLQAGAALGRLLVTTVNGQNEAGTAYDELYTFGARSFSIWRADTLQLVYDSGDDLAKKTAELLPELFNSDGEPLLSVAATIDTRSDDKGVEPASLALGRVGDVTLVMVGSERPGTVAVYSIDHRNPQLTPVFHTFIVDIRDTSGTWQSLYENRQASIIDPEDILFVSADDSPNGQPLLLASGSTSGTVDVIQLNVVTGNGPTDPVQVETTTKANAGCSTRMNVVLFTGILVLAVVVHTMF